MTSEADTDAVENEEEERLIRWHRDRLIALGWPKADADNLAREFDVDLHLLEQLLARGCTREQAWRIAS